MLVARSVVFLLGLFDFFADLIKLAAGLLILAGDGQGDHAWYLFQATGDILIHTAPYKIVDGKKVYQDIDALGVRPSSRGCIRIHPDDAEWRVKWNPQGAWIVITPWEGVILR